MRTILWERLDEPGWEVAAIGRNGRGWEANARYVGLHDGLPASAEYRLLLDEHWVCLRLEACWGVGPGCRRFTLERIGTRWWVDGAPRPDLDGCIDPDVGWSPLTNTLPVRRLGERLATPQEIAVAWIRPGSLTVEKARQRYERLGERAVRFEAPDSGFSAALEMDDEGLVAAYEGLFRRLAG